MLQYEDSLVLETPTPNDCISIEIKIAPFSIQPLKTFCCQNVPIYSSTLCTPPQHHDLTSSYKE